MYIVRNINSVRVRQMYEESTINNPIVEIKIKKRKVYSDLQIGQRLKREQSCIK